MSYVTNPDSRAANDRRIDNRGWTEAMPGSAFVRRVDRLPDGGVEIRLEYDPWFSAAEETQKTRNRPAIRPTQPPPKPTTHKPKPPAPPPAASAPPPKEDPRAIENRTTPPPPPTLPSAGRSPSVSEMYDDYQRLPENEFLRKYRHMSIMDYDRLGRQIAYEHALTKSFRRSPADRRPGVPAPKLEAPTAQQSRSLAELKKWDVAATDPIAAFVIATIDSVSKIVGTEWDPEVVGGSAAGISLLAQGLGMFGPGAARPRREATSRSGSQPRSAGGNRATQNRLSGPEIPSEPRPGQWVSMAQAGSQALEAQGYWAGRPGVWSGNSLILQEYQIGSTKFDNVGFDANGNLTSLMEFKWDYIGSIMSGNQKIADKLVEQATTQLAIADELGVPLEWHVAKTQLQNFQNVLGPEISARIKWVTYSLSQVRANWSLPQ